MPVKRSNKVARKSRVRKPKTRVRRAVNKSIGKRNASNKTNNKMLKLKNPNQSMVGYCVVCKKKGTTMVNCKYILNKHNGAVRVAGVCKKCGTKMNTFMGRDKFM